MLNRLKLSSVVLSSVLAFSTIVGCSSSPAGPAESKGAAGGSQAPQQEKKENIELQFWDMVWGPPEYIETAKKLVEKYNQEHPGIKVNYQSIPFTNWYQQFTTAIAGGTGPDVSTGAGYQAFQFYQMGAVAPIDDVIDEWKKDGKLNDFMNESYEKMKYDGHYVALPWAYDVRVPFYRKDIFEKAGVTPPKNWDELREVAKKLSKDGKYGIGPSGDTGGSQYLYALMINNGGGIFSADKKVDLMNERNVEAMNYLNSLVKDGSVNPAGAGWKSDDSAKSFGQGDVAIVIRNPGLPSVLPDLKGKIGVLDPIAGPHGDKGTVGWVNNIMLYKESKHPKEAKDFLKWWSENEKVLWTEGHTNQLPARQSFAKDPYFQNDEIQKAIIEKWIPIAKTTGEKTPSVFPELNEVEGEGVMQTMIQEMIMGKDPKQVMDKANQTIKKIMQEK